MKEAIMNADRVVLITGATGAVGRIVSGIIAGAGYRIALTSRSGDSLQKLASSLKLPEDRLMVFPADLNNNEDVQALIKAVSEYWGGVDILINIAGGWKGGTRIAELSEDEWGSTLDLNLRSAFLINRAVLPYMVQQGWGRIINFSSKAAENPGPKQAAYNVAKAGVVALTSSIAAEYRRSGISANTILPSIIDTPNNRKQMPDADFSRWVKPEEIGKMILFLCSEEGGSLNGASIPMYARV
jgi:NAD(P)-dependent dehydrogenase (short-subunit alcohol dehydrogenase family)